MTTKNISVSVIIPTYNRANFVTKAIDSILAQNYKDYEIIVVDDGSTDNTQEVLNAYRDRISYIYQDNAGVSAARNTGIRASCGEWIAFLDSDDRWMPEKLELQMRLVNRTRAKICFTNVILQRDPKAQDVSFNSTETLKNEKIFTEPFDLILDAGLTTAVQTMLIERKLLYRVGCFDERFWRGEDNLLIFRLAFEGFFGFIQKPCVIIDRVSNRKRLTRDSLGGGDDVENSLLSILIRFEAYFRCRNKNKQIVKKLRYLLGFFLSRTAVFHCLDKNRFDAKRFALDGIYFGRDLRTYAKCAAVLFCPWLVRKIHPRNKPRSEVATDI
ncbi:MAG: glycosyltransferase family 2 protein [Planctomycetota bacterium]